MRNMIVVDTSRTHQAAQQILFEEEEVCYVMTPNYIIHHTQTYQLFILISSGINEISNKITQQSITDQQLIT